MIDAEKLVFIAQCSVMMVKGHFQKIKTLDFFDYSEFPDHVSTIIPLSEESLGFESPQILLEKPNWLSSNIREVYAGLILPIDWANYASYRCSLISKSLGCVFWGIHKDNNIYILVKVTGSAPLCMSCGEDFQDLSYVFLGDISPDCALGFALSELNDYDINTPQ